MCFHEYETGDDVRDFQKFYFLQGNDRTRILRKLIRLSRSFVLLILSPCLYWILAINNGIM